MSDRHCLHCVYSVQSPTSGLGLCMMFVWSSSLLCVNHPESPGVLHRAYGAETCPHYRKRRERPVWTTPPEPAGDDVRHIALTKNRYALVDAADYEWLSKYKWTTITCGGNCYACRNDKGKVVLMHREIMQTPKGEVVDHKDGNGLNNRRGNMRNCTQQQNLMNSRSRGGKSRYKGVRHPKGKDRWIAEIILNGRKRWLGTFHCEIDAARAYDRAARELFGEFARLNFPDDPA